MINQLYTRVTQHKHVAILTLLLVLLYWSWWFPGLRVATDFPEVSFADLKVQLNYPNTWFYRGSIGFGGNASFTLWSWTMDFIAGTLASFGFTFEILERMMFIVPTLLLGTIGIWNLLKRYNLSKPARVVASFFYLSNTYILLLIDGGQLGIALALSWFPISYQLFTRSIKSGTRERIIAGLGLWILGVFDIRIVYIFGILLILRFFYEFIYLPKKEWRNWIWNWLKSVFVVATIFVALNAYWLIPFIKYPLSSVRISDLTKVSGLNFTQFKHSLTLLQPHWYENVFGKILPLRKEFLFIPLLVFFAPVLKRKSKDVWFWILVACAGVFLAKGANPPLSGVSSWIYANVPGFVLFRDSSKFFFLVTLSYSVLIAFTADELIKKFRKFEAVFLVLLICYFLFLARPVLLGWMTGTMSFPRYTAQYSKLAERLEEDKEFGRIFWIPSRPPLGYASPNHPSLEASRMESLRPFAIGTIGTYETQNFVREANYMGELFDILGIGYVAYPYFDPKRDDMSGERVDYYHTFLNQISGLPWLVEKIYDFPLPVFKTREHQEKFFLPSNTYLILGSDRIYFEMADLGAKFHDNAMIFLEENPGILKMIDQLSFDKVILYDKTETDLAAAYFPASGLIFPAKDLDFGPDSSGWWKRETGDLVRWRGFLQEKYGLDNLDFDYGGGWAIAEGEKRLTITNLQFSKDEVLLARVMESPRGGKVEFMQNGDLVGEVITRIENPEKVTFKLTGNKEVEDRFLDYDKADFEWIEVGKLEFADTLEIRTTGDINVVNALISVNPNEWGRALNEADELIKTKGLVWEELSLTERTSFFTDTSHSGIFYTRLSPTKYKVTVNGINKPMTLVFSETYDAYWSANNFTAYPIFSLINGFKVERDGDYEINFEPQKYVIPGLMISLVTLGGAVFLLYNLNRRDKGTPKNRDN